MMLAVTSPNLTASFGKIRQSGELGGDEIADLMQLKGYRVSDGLLVMNPRDNQGIRHHMAELEPEVARIGT